MRLTTMTARDVAERLDDRQEITTGRNRALLFQLQGVLTVLERHEQTQKQWLYNPIAANQSGAWQQVNELVKRLAYESAPESLRDELRDLETELLNSGALQ